MKKNHVWTCFKSMNTINEKHKFKTCPDKHQLLIF